MEPLSREKFFKQLPDFTVAQEIASQVSAALAEIVRRAEVEPAWVIAKGGITSYDVAVKGVGMRRALVLGQIAPGIPVWRTYEEGRWPGIPYVVFPGNVGDDNTLVEIVRTLRQ